MRTKTLVSGIWVGATATLIIGAALWAAGPTPDRPRVSDVTKMSVERPVAAVIKNASLAVDQPAVIDRATYSNPAVKPGLVCWHSSFALACEASKRTHKPVLLFQLLGKLDHQFC
jgi:hypothetical protein